MTAEAHFDFFVIGGGSGGVRAARIAAGHGVKVGLAESSRLGGTCVNLGCIPKKLFAYAADFGLHIADSKAYGWDPGTCGFDWKTLVASKDREIERLNGIYENMLKKAGVQLFEGYARFVDSRTVEINGTRITADKFLIATGGYPRLPDIPGANEMLTSDDMFHLDALPEKIVILGGGYIGIEFARIMYGLGVDVTLIHHGDMVLRGFDRDIRAFICREMENHGVNLVLESEISEIRRTEDCLEVHTDKGDIHTCGLVLAAIGRNPHTKGLNLEAAGVEINKTGHIPVNEEFESSVPHILAVGDVSSRLQLTPVALAEGHRVADKLFASRSAFEKRDYDCVPTAVFSSPPISTAGLTEEQAREQGFDVEIYKSEFTPLKHTLTERKERTLMKLVVDKKSERVLGCHMAGLDAPEIMQGFAVALQMGARKSDFDRTIGIHPTSAEEFVTMRTPVDN